MHGKVSRVRHDNRGCFKDIPQGIESIRYHSLSAQPDKFPKDLVITSVTEDNGVTMGVRHRKYTLESVQYHPESILSEGDDELFEVEGWNLGGGPRVRCYRYDAATI